MLEKATTTTPVEAASAEKSTDLRGLRFQRYFTKPGTHPFDLVEWELRTALISNEKGEKIFEQKMKEAGVTFLHSRELLENSKRTD